MYSIFIKAGIRMNKITIEVLFAHTEQEICYSPYCNSYEVIIYDKNKLKHKRFQCKACKHVFIQETNTILYICLEIQGTMSYFRECIFETVNP